MANRGDLRTDFRRIVQETVEDQFSDARCNYYLDLGLLRLCRYIFALNPDAIRAKYTRDVVDASSDPERLKVYNLPSGAIRLVSLKYRATSADDYAELPKIPYGLTVSRPNRATSAELSWAPWGQHFFILDPPPSAAISQGLLAEVVENASMSADSDVPAVALSLHEAIPLLAKRRALFESGESLSAEEKRNLDEVLSEIPAIYHAGQGGPEYVVPQVNKGY